ncbi:MAG TPA: thiamine-binding protein [Segetibacter sp.]
MHNYIVNASIQILPIVQDKHPYEWVDEAISVIQKSGIKYKIGPFATVVEGSYEEVMHVVNNVNDHLIRNKCNEWITSVQFNIRSNSDITANEKVSKFIV